MSQRLWENPEYDDNLTGVLLKKLEKCLRHKRYTEAHLVLVHLQTEIETLAIAEKAVRKI